MEKTACDTCVYKTMYLHLAKAAEDALRILIKAQQECEDIFLNNVEVCPNCHAGVGTQQH